MSTLPEQFSAATKANFDTQLAILSTFTNKAFESMEKVVELNLTAAKTSFEESNATVKKLIKDPQEIFNLTTAQANADKASDYARHLASIFSNAQAELAKTAEAHIGYANASYEQFNKLSKQALDQFTQATVNAVPRVPKKV